MHTAFSILAKKNIRNNRILQKYNAHNIFNFEEKYYK